MKFGRNLTASEILDQALHFRRIEDVDHAVFMGMGEPMMNLDNVLERGAAAARPRHHPPPHDDLDGRLAAGHRAPGRGPRADPPGAQPARARRRAALADHAGQRALAAGGRARRLPALARAQAPPRVHRVRDARRRQRPATPRRCQLAELLGPDVFKVNLIPYNPTGSIYEGSSREAIAAFKRGARGARRPGDRPPDARPRHRRRLRPARRGAGLTDASAADRLTYSVGDRREELRVRWSRRRRDDGRRPPRRDGAHVGP